MSLIVQDDTGSVVGANAYIDVDYFKNYHDDRGQDYSAADSDQKLEQAIIRATDYLDNRFNFVGKRYQGRSQSTEWPRSNARDRDGYYVRGIPPEVKEACAEYALRAIGADLSPDPVRDDTGALIASKSEAVGPLSESVTYVSGASFAMPNYPVADQKLLRAGLTRTGGTVLRG